MEIRRWLYYAVVNCALVSYIIGKPFSLNKLIESESAQKETVVLTTISPKIEELEPAAERFSLNKGLKPLSRISKKYKQTGTTLNFIPLGKKLSPLKYRKTFQIKSPLKPKRVKHSFRTRNKRKNQSIKREIDGHALLNQKYIPLLRSLGMLFDNILGSGSRESLEETKHRKRLKYIVEGDQDISCQCPHRRDFNTGFESEEEAVTSSETLSPKIEITTETTTTTADNTSISNLGSFRQHKDVPILLPRNTSSTWRNDHGFSERSRTAYNGSVERYISRNNGDSEHNPKHRQKQPDAQSDEEYSDSDSRDDAGGSGIRGDIRDRKHRNYAEKNYENESQVDSEFEAKNITEKRENTAEFNGPYKHTIKRNKGKSGKLLSKPVRRQREFLSNEKVINSAKSLQPDDNNKESVVGIAHNSSDDQRLIDRNGSHSKENQKVYARIETVTAKLSGITTSEYYSTEFSKETDNDYNDLVGDSSEVEIDDFTNSEQIQGNNKESGFLRITQDSSGVLDVDNSRSTDNQVDTRTETLIPKFSEMSVPEHYSAKNSGETEIKNLIAVSMESEHTKDSYRENDESKSYDGSDKSSLDNNGSTIKEDDEANKKIYTMLHKKPVVGRSGYIFKTSKLKGMTLFNTTTEAQHTENNEEIHANEDTTKAKSYSVTQRSPMVDIPQYFSQRSKTSRSRGPVVTIIDGYSVTRHKNGENKLAEKAIHIRP